MQVQEIELEDSNISQSIFMNNVAPQSICEVSLQLSKKNVKPKYFWQNLSPYEYLDSLDISRERTIFLVSNWFDESSKNIDIIIPIFLKGIDNLHKKVIELELIWTQLEKNIKLIILREKNYLSKLRNSNITRDFNDVHRLESRKEGLSKLEEFMREILPILDEHKDEQRRIIESGITRLDFEILKPIKKKLIDLKTTDFKDSSVIYKRAEECLENVRTKMQKQRDAYIKFRETGDNNQSLNGSKKRAKKDTLKCLIRLGVQVGEVFNTLKELSDIVNEFWNMYEKLGKYTYENMVYYHRKLNNIMEEYFYPLSKSSNKDFFDSLKEKKELTDLEKLNTLLKEKYIKLITSHTNLRGRAAFEDIVNRYGFSFNQDFENFIGES